MLAGQLVFSQLMREFPIKAFSRMVASHRAQHKVKDFSCLDQFYVMAYAQLAGRDSLRSIELNLRMERAQWYHMGLRCKGISRNTLAHANATRPWQVFAELAQHLIGTATALYADDKLNGPLLGKLKATVYALDSTTIDLCLSLFPWAPFRQTKAAVKLHTLLDLRGSIPSFIHISNGKMHDVKMLDILADQGLIEAGAFYVMDKAYVDFKRLYSLECAKAYFVTRAKRNMQCLVVQRQTFTANTGVSADEWVGVLDQQYDACRIDDLRAVQESLACRIVLQVDQATLAHPALLRHQRERAQDADLVRHCNLRAGGDHQKETELASHASRYPSPIGFKYVQNYSDRNTAWEQSNART
jgi:Domain of unknown function (DUF4372)/Transposase DDE domain